MIHIHVSLIWSILRSVSMALSTWFKYNSLVTFYSRVGEDLGTRYFYQSTVYFCEMSKKGEKCGLGAARSNPAIKPWRIRVHVRSISNKEYQRVVMAKTWESCIVVKLLVCTSLLPFNVVSKIVTEANMLAGYPWCFHEITQRQPQPNIY